MLISDLENTIKGFGYPHILRDTNSRLIVYMEGKERVEALKAFAEKLNGTYTNQKNGNGWKSSVGATFVGQYIILAKPSTSGTSNIASIDARVFSAGGTDAKFPFGDQLVSCKMFSSAKTLENSIITGIKGSTMLGEAYSEAVESFFASGKIAWDPSTPLPILNKLGVYLGELLVGWVLLSGSASKHFSNNPFLGTATKFYIPTDPAFSGVDSFIEMSNGSYYAISSKYGAGAKASFFTNLFDKGVKNYTKLPGSEFGKMATYAASNNIRYDKSREFVYAYGIHNILNIPKSKIPNANKVYEDIRSNNKSPDVQVVSDAIRKYSKDPKITNTLPNSVSAFFTRTMADRLNSDRNSITQMKEILSGKDYWQANLNIAEWTKGNVNFKFINSGDSELKLIGSKSSIEDVTAKQGWINYELRYT